MRWKQYLFARLCVQQDPAKLNDLGGVLGNIYAVLITRRSNVYYDIAVEVRCLRRGGGLGGHYHRIAEGTSCSVIFSM